jgi:ABC-2 type transport system ATP-binding protein
MPAIEVAGLRKTFGGFTAVDGISFSVAQGEIFGLLGPNGAGKSTLIRMLTTLVPPSAGVARVAGRDVVRDADGVRRAIGVIPQNLTSDRELTVEENLLIHAKLQGVARRGRGALIAGLLEAVGLADRAGALVKTLSGGMRRRVEIARGLVHRPRILFLDEPTTGLDPVSRAQVFTLLREVKAAQGLTVVLTTHYLDEADQLCDRIAIVDRGRLVALDTPLRLKAGIPGESVVDVAFAGAPAGWADRLAGLAAARQVSGGGDAFRVVSADGPATVRALLEAAEAAGATVRALAVASTSLDDVFVQLTGRPLREADGPPAEPTGEAA